MEIKAQTSGYITGVNTEGYGTASLLLGAGRNTKDDKIDFSAGIKLIKKTGDKVEKGEVIAILYTSEECRFESAAKHFIEATYIGNNKPIPGLKLQRTDWETNPSSDLCEGAAWLSSARAVRCRLKCHNERNPCQ